MRLQIAIGFENDLEAELLQRRFHRLAVIDRIGERPHQPVVVIGNDQRHAPLRHRGCGGRKHQQQGKQKPQVEPPPAQSPADHSISLWHEQAGLLAENRLLYAARIGFSASLQRDSSSSMALVPPCTCSLALKEPSLSSSF